MLHNLNSRKIVFLSQMYYVIKLRKYTSVVKISYSISIRNADDTYKREGRTCFTRLLACIERQCQWLFIILSL